MAESELYQKGTEMRSKLMGAATVDKLAKTVYDDPMMKKFSDYARQAVFGMLWTAARSRSQDQGADLRGF